MSQARIYLAMAKTGKATVRTISKSSDLARQEIERVAADLQKLGLVERVLTTPLEFNPLPINEAISLLLQKRATETSLLEKRASMLVEAFRSSRPKCRAEDDCQFVILSNKNAIIKKILEVSNRTQRKSDAVVSWNNFLIMGRVFENQDLYALPRPVKSRCVSQKPPSKQEAEKVQLFARRNPNFRVKFVPFIPQSAFSIADERELLISTSTKKAIGESPILWTDNPSLVKAVHSYFDKLWKEAVPLTEIMA